MKLPHRRGVLAVSIYLAVGLLPWIWIGSYVGFAIFGANDWRNRLSLLSAPSPYGPGIVTIRTICIPEELAWLKPAYDPLARFDEMLTGHPTRVSIEHPFNFTIGYKF